MNKQKNKTKMRIILFIAIFLACIMFFAPKVKASSFLNALDNLDGVKDSEALKNLNVICSVTDIAKWAASNSDGGMKNFWGENSQNVLSELLGKDVADVSSGHPMYLAQSMCIHNNTLNYGSRENSTYKISAIIDINLGGSGQIIVHEKKNGEITSTVVSNTTTEKYLYVAAYYAYLLEGKGGSSTSDPVLWNKDYMRNAIQCAYDNDATLKSTGVGGNLYNWAPGVKEDLMKMVGTDSSKYYRKYEARFIVCDGLVGTHPSGHALQSQLIYKGRERDSRDIQIVKVGPNNEKLKNAKFYIYSKTAKKYLKANKKFGVGKTSEITNANDYYFITDANGKISITGIPVGDYVAVEKEAPSGYIKKSGNIQLEVQKATKIVNQKKVTLKIYKYDKNTNIQLQRS